MSARPLVLDGTIDAASIAAAEARLSIFLGWAEKGDIILHAGTKAKSGRPRPATVH